MTIESQGPRIAIACSCGKTVVMRAGARSVRCCSCGKRYLRGVAAALLFSGNVKMEGRVFMASNTAWEDAASSPS